MHDEDTSIVIPIDIFTELSIKYGIALEELAKAFSRGAVDGLNYRDEKLEKRRDKLGRMFGTPERSGFPVE
jgi:hypothetical protein